MRASVLIVGVGGGAGTLLTAAAVTEAGGGHKARASHLAAAGAAAGAAVDKGCACTCEWVRRGGGGYENSGPTDMAKYLLALPLGSLGSHRILHIVCAQPPLVATAPASATGRPAVEASSEVKGRWSAG